MANWISCSKQMPEEHDEQLLSGGTVKRSKRVLAYDSMYGARIDYTVNGEWHSEKDGGICGQIVHGIMGWMEIPEYDADD